MRVAAFSWVLVWVGAGCSSVDGDGGVGSSEAAATMLAPSVNVTLKTCFHPRFGQELERILKRDALARSANANVKTAPNVNDPLACVVRVNGDQRVDITAGTQQISYALKGDALLPGLELALVHVAGKEEAPTLTDRARGVLFELASLVSSNSFAAIGLDGWASVGGDVSPVAIPEHELLNLGNGGTFATSIAIPPAYVLSAMRNEPMQIAAAPSTTGGDKYFEVLTTVENRASFAIAASAGALARPLVSLGFGGTAVVPAQHALQAGWFASSPIVGLSVLRYDDVDAINKEALGWDDLFDYGPVERRESPPCLGGAAATYMTQRVVQMAMLDSKSVEPAVELARRFDRACSGYWVGQPAPSRRGANCEGGLTQCLAGNPANQTACGAGFEVCRTIAVKVANAAK